MEYLTAGGAEIPKPNGGAKKLGIPVLEKLQTFEYNVIYKVIVSELLNAKHATGKEGR